MDGSIVIVTPPAAEPVTLQEAKDWCRGPTSADDTLITSLITVARRYIEKIASRALITQTWDYWLDYFPGSNWYATRFVTPGMWGNYWELRIPRPPLQSISSIKYTDPTTGSPVTLAGTEYTVDIKREPGRVVPAYQKSWPSPRSGIPNAVQVTFVAGYGAAGSAVPDELKTAIKVLIAKLYEKREAVTDVSERDVPLAFWNLVNEFRAWTL
jgi:uncharacterized phiE125 gp8 family phage protein